MPNPTINDVARLAGVSKKTVRRVVNHSPLLGEATQTRAEQVIAELGYVPNPQAQALAQGFTPAAVEARGACSLIVLVHNPGNLELALGAQQGVLEAIRDSEHALVVHSIDRSAPTAEEDWCRFLETRQPAGVLLLPGVAEVEPIVRACQDGGIDYVRVSASAFDEPARLVSSNDREAAAAATGHLIALGHQRIGFVAGPDEPGSAQERELGYLDAMADHDLDRGPALIAAGDGSFESGVEAGGLLLEVSPSPTAIFAANDAMAAGVLHAVHARGLAVPENLSIVGFDDTTIAAQLWPPLTTVQMPIAAMARAAVLKLIDPETDADLPVRFRLKLIARTSAGPAAD